jgi:hypothetical protein
MGFRGIVTTLSIEGLTFGLNNPARIATNAATLDIMFRIVGMAFWNLNIPQLILHREHIPINYKELELYLSPGNNSKVMLCKLS